MRLKRDPFLKLMTVTFFIAIFWTIGVSAKAADKPQKRVPKKAATVKEHEIGQGETLGQIALKYGIGLPELMAANHLDNADKIFFGQRLVIPGEPKDGVLTKQGVTVRIPKGFSLSRVAVAYGVPLRTIIKANNLSNPDSVREGRKLLIPGARHIVELIPPPPCLKDEIAFYRVRTDETLELSVSYCNGKPTTDALTQLTKFSQPVKKPTDIKLHPRLVQLLQKIADRYPGRRIEIISGPRARKQPLHESYHTKGMAMDFRVEGVSNYQLTQYVRQFENVGVGYYPNSVFIHMDTRERNAYWIDYSGQGEKAIYARKGLSEESLEEIRAERKTKKEKTTEAFTAKHDEQADAVLEAEPVLDTPSS